MISLLSRVYGLGLHLLPRGLREEFGDEMRADFEALLHDAPGLPRRVARAVRCLAALPGVALAERLSAVRSRAGAHPRDEALPHATMTTTRRIPTMDALSKDLRYALRSLGRARGFTLSAVLLLSLGIGAVTASFTVVDQVLLRPLPYPNQERLAYMTNGSHPGPVLRELDGIEGFEAVAMWTGSWSNLTRTDGEPLRLLRYRVNAPFWSLFGARPAHGRLLVAADGDTPNRAVLAHGTWQRVFGADPGVVGRTVNLDGQPVEVVGVVSADFQSPQSLTGGEPDLYLPMDWADPQLDEANIHRHTVVPLLARGVSIEVADRQIDALGDRLRERFPEGFVDRDGNPERWPLVPLSEQATAQVSGGLWLLLGAVGLLLLVACVNVAHLVLARALGRDREMAVRRALGASAGALARQLLLEKLVLGMLGGAGGLLLAWGALAGFRTWTTLLPRGASLALDLRVAAFALATAALTAVVFGMIPAVRAMRRDPRAGLHASGRGSTAGRRVQALRGGLVVVEVALSLVMVALAGVLTRSFLSVTTQDPGIVADRVVALPLNLSENASPAEWNRHVEELRRSVGELPGVEAATYALELPFQFTGGQRCCWGTRIGLPGEPEGDAVRASVHAVHEDFFDVFGVHMIAGSPFSRMGADVAPTRAVLSESAAVRLYGSAEAAVGREFSWGSRVSEVVGVMADTRHYGMDQDHGEAVYVHTMALPFAIPEAALAVRLAPGSTLDGGALREAVWRVDPNQPIPDVTPVSTWVDASSSLRRFASLLAATFGAVALLLAAGGLYGTLLHAVRERRRELGIRMALGASAARLQGAVVARGLVLAGLGALVGTGVAWYASRLLEPLVWGVTPRDPLALGASAAGLLATAIAASWIPARRAANTSPLETLGAE